MPIKRRASTILGAFEKAQADLVGKPWCWSRWEGRYGGECMA